MAVSPADSTYEEGHGMGTHGILMTRFFWVLLFASVVVSVLGVISLSVLAMRPPIAMIALPPAVAAWDAGKRYMQEHDTPPPEGEAWMLCLIFLLIFLGTMFALIGGAIAAQGGSIASLGAFLQPAL
ncbi:MAG: ABZJ_00895 family protein, partial [Pseudomonadota bacterium]